MIKRIQFAGAGAGAGADADLDAAGSEGATAAFVARWRDGAASSAEAPPAVRPVRIALCTALPAAAEVVPGDDAPRHGAVGLQWFTDADHLARFEAWLGSTPEQVAAEQRDRARGIGANPVVVADELVMRGADWLERRWHDGGARCKHMALAWRAPDLTAAQFADRWRTGEGRVQTSGREAVVIPDVVRGQAYVQNHPRPRAEGDWAYDAVNEVSFDDPDDLRTRVEWFRDRIGADAERDLIARNWFLAVREEVLFAAR